jgi:small GTP-binding protein
MGEGFQGDYLATLGAEFMVKEYKDNQLLIWDLGGHRDFMNVFDAYLQGGQGLILVFDIIRSETLDSISTWIDYFIKANNKIVPGILVANKIDLRDPDVDTVQEDEARTHLAKLSEKYNISFQYVETSALTGENIELAFENLVEELIEYHDS